MCTASTPSSEEPSRFPHPRPSSLPLCDTAALRVALWLLIKLKPVALPSGGCVASLLSLCYTPLLQLSSGNKHLSAKSSKSLSSKPLWPWMCILKSVCVWGPAARLCFLLSPEGVDSRSVLPLVTVGCYGGKPPLKAPCWHLTVRCCPLLCVKIKPRVTTTRKLNFSSHTPVTLNIISSMIKGQCQQFYTLKCTYWYWGVVL